MPGKSGAPLRSFRVPEPIWQAFSEATEEIGTNPLTALRDFVRWYVGLGRMERQRFLRESGRTFAILLEQSVLHAGIGGPEVWAGQLGHLVSAAMRNVSLGIVPFGSSREAAWTVETFYMFDETEVNVELVSGYLTVKQPREIEMYAQVFTELSSVAVFGAPARRLISEAIEATTTSR